jgi:hypothetical protein
MFQNSQATICYRNTDKTLAFRVTAMRTSAEWLFLAEIGLMARNTRLQNNRKYLSNILGKWLAEYGQEPPVPK